MADPLNTVSAPATSPGELSPEKPRRQGNDSLWKRARRTLGTNQLTFLQPQSKPSPGNDQSFLLCLADLRVIIQLSKTSFTLLLGALCLFETQHGWPITT